ncbi:type I restriction enzyme S subunit [Mariniflexile fucanivorans]|uniref:Type I restriction enzyme S subunit n=1 Tax=Mariniflexile fucanivorans TaxID=264023 RepID=A0A4R1RMM6_9FLAO|nr:restriction endonuclease subunit S [Mariniflexile fucanivorans]TCL67535.1 type I restriction enzyme S subunit [Mariniflexile fucanivorans]
MSEVKNIYTEPSRSIPDGWVETTLGEICNPKGGKRLPKGMTLVNYKTNHPYIRITDFNGNQINKNQLQYVTDDIFKHISRYIVNENDVVITIVGTVGLVAQIDRELDKASLTENCTKLVDLKNVDHSYLYYFLISKNGQDEIVKNTVGAVQKKLPIYGVQNINITLPTIPEQKSIADILIAFDNKIELLQAQNKTLEETAQTIFAEWFGKYQIEDELPDGWRVGKLGDLVIKISKGTTPTKNDLIGLRGEVPFLKVKDISNDGLILKNNLELIPKIIHENQLKRSILETDDVLFSIAGTIGRIAIVDLEMNNSNCNQALAFIRLKDKHSFLEYIHLWLKSKETQDVIISNIVQGVQANVSLTVLSNLLLLIPSLESINNWCNLIKPIYQKYQTNTKQIQTLTKTRDELLPRLMSGEVRVSEL